MTPRGISLPPHQTGRPTQRGRAPDAAFAGSESDRLRPDGRVCCWDQSPEIRLSTTASTLSSVVMTRVLAVAEDHRQVQL
jgi:hypothetical protein